MKPESRVLVFTLTLMLAVPFLYALGEWLGGALLGALLCGVPGLASYLWARRGREPAPAAAPPVATAPSVPPPPPAAPDPPLPPGGILGPPPAPPAHPAR